MQNLAPNGLVVPQEGQPLELRVEPHLIQCFAPTRTVSPHLSHFPGMEEVSGCFVGARALGEKTSDRITTSPTVAILSCPTSNSRGKSLSSSRLLNCSLSTESSRDLMSPVPFGTAFRTRPTIIPWESITCKPVNASILTWVSLMKVDSARLSMNFSQA